MAYVPRVLFQVPHRRHLKYADHGPRQLARIDDRWSQLARRFPGIEVQPLFRSVSPARLDAWWTQNRPPVVQRGERPGADDDGVVPRPADERPREDPDFGARVRRFEDAIVERLEQPVRPVQEATPIAPKLGPDDPMTWFTVRMPPNTDPHAVRAELESWRTLLNVYAESPPQPPPAPVLKAPWRHLEAPPWALGHMSLGQIVGGTGADMRYVDVEQGWTHNHNDLPRDVDGAPAIRHIYGLNARHFGHGTAVLGVLSGVQNQREDAYGVVPSAEGRTVSPFVRPGDPRMFGDAVAGVAERECECGCICACACGSATAPGFDLGKVDYSLPDAIIAAALLPENDPLQRGDVILIEAQTRIRLGSKWSPYVAVEVEPAVFAAIRWVTRAGFIVVEAAGNGNSDLDDYLVHDSNAVIVGAATSNVDGDYARHRRAQYSTWGSNWGQRVDCSAWGGEVITLGLDGDARDRDAVTRVFDGTSSASALVAGAIVGLQGALKMAGKPTLTARQIRELIRAHLLELEGAGASTRNFIGSAPAPVQAGLFDLRTMLGEAFS